MRSQPLSIVEQVRNHAKKRPSVTALRHKRAGGWEETTWGSFWDQAKRLAAGFKHHGFEPQDRTAIFSYNRPEWLIFDLATSLLRGASAPIYMNNTADQAAYILDHTEAKFVLVDDQERLDRVLAKRGELGLLQLIVTTWETGSDDASIISFAKLMEAGNAPSDEEADGWLEAQQPDDLGSIIYTSGTTGTPKGVMLDYDNLVPVMSHLPELLPGFDQATRVFSYLPLAHVAQRAGDYAAIYAGATLDIADSIENFPELIQESQPTFFVAVPRVLEKVYAKVKTQVAAASPLRQKIFAWAESVALQYCHESLAGYVSPWTRFQWPIADALVYSKIKSRLGGQVKHIVAGGAALPKHIGEFFYGIGIPVIEAYGMTESAALICFARPQEVRYGTVNKPLPMGEVRISHEGEIQYKGPNVMRGYYKNEQATARAITEDGWLCTGDLGEMTSDGYVKITGRKKEMIITSGGKNIAPVPIETTIKQLPFVSQAMVVGDGRPYLTALVTLAAEELPATLERLGEKPQPGEDLTAHPAILNAVAEHIDKVNADLPSFMTVKKHKVLSRDFEVEQNELTPTLKLRRKAVHEHFAKEIRGLYGE